MRFTFFFVSAACLMLAGACSDDDNKTPTPDLMMADTQAKPDVAKPDTQPTADLAAPDKAPHFDFTVPKCPNEVNLSGKEPCMCGTTLIYDIKSQYAECVSPKVVKCCPLDGKPKCE